MLRRELLAHRGDLRLQRGDLVSPREDGIILTRSRAALQNAMPRDHLSGERHHGRAADLREDAQCRRQIGHEHGVVHQTFQQPRHFGLRLDLVDEPVNRAFGELHRLVADMHEDAVEIAQGQRRLAELLGGERLDHRFGHHRVLHHDRLDLRAKHRLDRGNEFRRDIHALRERAVDRGFEKVRIVQTAEHGLGSLAQPLAAVVELLQHLQARLAIRQHTQSLAHFNVQLTDLRLRVAVMHLGPTQCGGALLEFMEHAAQLGLRAGQFLVRACKRKFKLADLAGERGQAGLGGFALLEHGADLRTQTAQLALGAGCFVIHRRDLRIRLLSLRAHPGGLRLHFLHPTEFRRKQLGDLLHLAIHVAELRLGHAEFFLRPGDVHAITLHEARKFRRALRVETQPALVVRDPRPQILHCLPRAVEPPFHFFHRGALRIRLLFLRRHRDLRFVMPHRQRLQLRHVRSARAVQFVELPLRLVRLQRPQILQHPLVTPRLRSLPLHAADLPLHFLDDVRKPHQIHLRRLQLAQRLLALALVFRDARRLLENRPPILGPRRQDQVNLPLLHDRIRAAPDARIHEQRVDVLQPARRPVQQILAAALAENAPRDFHLMPVQPELLLALAESHRDLRHAQRRTRVRAGENHVRHFTAAQRLRRLLAEHPSNRVQHVRLTAPVRPHDARHAGVEIEDGLGSEGLESEDFEAFEIHDLGREAVSEKWDRPAVRLRQLDLDASDDGSFGAFAGCFWEENRANEAAPEIPCKHNYEWSHKNRATASCVTPSAGSPIHRSRQRKEAG